MRLKLFQVRRCAAFCWTTILSGVWTESGSCSPPEVPETTVGPDLLQPLQVFSQFVIQTVGQDLQHKQGCNIMQDCVAFYHQLIHLTGSRIKQHVWFRVSWSAWIILNIQHYTSETRTAVVKLKWDHFHSGPLFSRIWSKSRLKEWAELQWKPTSVWSLFSRKATEWPHN